MCNGVYPTTVKEVQRFLGFANYYRRFNRGFGQVAAPITSLLKVGSVRLQWSAGADRAFGYLKDLFTSAPVLAHPDPSLAFIVGVDASEAGIGAVLSQRSGTDIDRALRTEPTPPPLSSWAPVRSVCCP
jgi:hypothetical protein